ncbi:hypothetical protein [Chryseobacterium defluvii]|nr:hypothetical protein [Chryseobacterium defluvii]
MEKIQLLCKKCAAELSEVLSIVPETRIVWIDERDILKDGQCAFSINNNKKVVLTNLRDERLINHSELVRFSGCCGSSGSDGMNKLCKNGHEVATEFSDCWISRYLEFSLDHVTIKEVL